MHDGENRWENLRLKPEITIYQIVTLKQDVSTIIIYLLIDKNSDNSNNNNNNRRTDNNESENNYNEEICQHIMSVVNDQN